MRWCRGCRCRWWIIIICVVRGSLCRRRRRWSRWGGGRIFWWIMIIITDIVLWCKHHGWMVGAATFAINDVQILMLLQSKIFSELNFWRGMNLIMVNPPWNWREKRGTVGILLINAMTLQDSCHGLCSRSSRDDIIIMFDGNNDRSPSDVT